VIRALLVAALWLSLAWAAAITAAPLCLRSASVTARALAVAPYVVGSRICHQSPPRSFSFAGVPMPVCARCAGLYVGVPFGILAGLAGARARPDAPSRAARWLALAAAPTLLSVLVERAGVLPVPIWLRATLGAGLSGLAAFVVTAQLRAEDRASR
jgi:hypothetical protein